MRFDAATLRRVDAAYEVEIETTRPDGTTRRTIIWAVVEAGDVYVRSWKGDRGHWFQAALDRPAEVSLVVDELTIPARAVLAIDDVSVARCSAGLSKKYRADSALKSMLRKGVLGTTIRLEPR